MSERWMERVKALENEANRLWDEHDELVNAIDGLHWWQRPWREAELRARLRKARFEIQLLSDRARALGPPESRWS